MKPTQALHDLGQSLWLDNITRTMLSDGTLARYIDELSVTGLTSNPTIFDKAITGGDAYDEQITELTEQGVDPEDIFFALALQLSAFFGASWRNEFPRVQAIRN